MLRFGIIGAGNIAHRFANGLSHEENAYLYAISGRNKQKLEAFQKQFPCEKIYIGFENLLEDPIVDAVYISLPHHMHKEWIIKALKAHKAVLVEKPAVLNSQEMQEVIEVAKKEQVLFMEAQKERFTPAYRAFIERYKNNEWGKLRKLSISFCNKFPYFLSAITHSYLYSKECGGALLDVGTYNASLICDLIDGEHTINTCQAFYKNDVDTYIHANFKMADTIVDFETGLDRQTPRDAKLIFENTEIIIHDFHRPTAIDIINGNEIETLHMEYDHDDFYSQIHHFTNLFHEHKTTSPIMSLDDSLKTSQLLDFISNEAQKVKQTIPLLKEETMTSEEMLALEDELSFSAFTHEDAFQIGCIAIDLAKKQNKAIRAGIVYENSLVFQHLMDGKKDDTYLKMKHDIVMNYHHSTWYFVTKMMEGDIEYLKLLKERKLYPVGGGFPIYVNGELCGSICVSGLTDPEDQHIVTQAIKIFKERRK